jgi:hypothetical protein
MLSAAPRQTIYPNERRRHQRVRIHLFGRFMLSNRSEYPCQIVNISPGGLAMIAPVSGRVGERVVIYANELGRLEGDTVRLFNNGFSIQFNATDRKRDKLAAQLTWLANRHQIGLPDDRRHERVVPRNSAGRLTLPDGTIMPCRIIDVSVSGAAVSMAQPLPLGAPVTLGRSNGRVSRVFEGGIAIEFARELHPDLIEESLFQP